MTPLKTSSILDNSLYINLDLSPADRLNHAFLNDKGAYAHFTSQLLIYDQIIIPTKDFGIIPALIHWMGDDIFIEALDNRTLAFVRPDFLIGYAGNGNGLQMAQIHPGEKGFKKWWIEATWGDFEIAPELQLKHCCSFISKRRRSQMVDKILSSSNKFEFNKAYTFSKLVNETIEEIKYDPHLINFILSKEPNPIAGAHLSRLSGIEPNQLRILSRFEIKDGIDLVLRIAQTNLELAYASVVASSDVNISQGAEHLIKNKFERSGLQTSKIDAILKLFELVNIPDIRHSIQSDELEFKNIWELRHKKVSVQFREWMQNIEIKSPQDLQRLYVESLENQNLVSRLPSRILRFIAVSAIAAVAPIAGIAASVTDSFFVNKWFSGFSPKLFIDEVRKLPYKG